MQSYEEKFRRIQMKAREGLLTKSLNVVPATEPSEFQPSPVRHIRRQIPQQSSNLNISASDYYGDLYPRNQRRASIINEIDELEDMVNKLTPKKRKRYEQAQVYKSLVRKNDF